MRLDPPGFWDRGREHDWRALALAPLGEVYHRIVQHRLSRQAAEAPVPVICIGNATMGGVGKTPFVRMLAEALQARGHAPHVLTRGYGGTERGLRRVEATDAAARVGDEPLMLSATLPVWVSPDRVAGAAAAAAAGASVIVMDDGFQNPSLAKALSLMLVDAASLFGNGRVFPAGPLREHPAAAAARADGFVAVGPDPAGQVQAAVSEIGGGKPLFQAWFELDKSSIPNQPLFAFCGIGRPERFKKSLLDCGAKILDYRSFPDHHRFSTRELTELRRDAERQGGALVTTEKDHVRLAPADRDGITAVRGGMKVSDETALLRLVESQL